MQGDDTDSYRFTELKIRNRQSADQNLEFSAMVIECEISQAHSPTWIITVFSEDTATSHYFYDKAGVFPNDIDNYVDTLSKKNWENGKPINISLTPGHTLAIPHFGINCIPTYDDAKPLRVRMRFFTLLPSTKETFSTNWTSLPNIRGLSYQPDTKELRAFHFD